MLTSTQIALALGGALAAIVLIRVLSTLVKVKVDVSFRDLRHLSLQIHEFVGPYMNANYGGDPSQLASAMSGLLPQVRAIAAGMSPQLDDAWLRTMVASSIAAHHIARRDQAEAAFDEALRLEQRAA